MRLHLWCWMWLLGGCVGQITETDKLLPGAAQANVCETGGPHLSHAPIRRFTAVEYNRTVREVFSGLTLRPQVLAADPKVDGFDNNAAAQSPSPLLIEQLRNSAIAIAGDAAADLASWAPCPADEGRDCALQIARLVSERAYRRPLRGDEISAIETFAGGVFDDYGFETAVRLSLEGILQTPQFLYKPEFGDDDRASGGRIPLTGYEVATRLSYFLWGTMPDAALLTAAREGELDSASGLREHAERMLADPQAREGVARFHAQWFKLAGLETVAPDTEVFPEFTPEVRASLIEATERFLDYAFWDVGTARGLFSDRSMFVNDALAQVYDLEPPGGDELRRVEFPEDQRAGILTQPGWLASTSHARQHAPILRGVFVRRSVLCAPLPPPPANVSTVLMDPAPDRPRTTRQHIAETHVSEECASCHRAIDGIGFAFENYNAIGRFVTEENGLPVDPTGELVGISGISKTEVENGVELATTIADADQARSCVATQWFRYAMGRSANDTGSRCQAERLGAGLMRGDGDLNAMLLDLITSDFFRYLPAP